MFKKPLLITTLFVVLSLCIAVPRQAYALTLSPIRYEIAGNPGEVLTQDLKVFNESKESHLYYVSFSNFEAQGDSGSPTFIDPKDDLGTWITSSVASVNLGAGEQKTISFKIAIPKDAEPGGHFAALFLGTTAPGESNGVSIGTKTGALILLSVNGDVKEQAGLVDFSLHNNKHFYKELPVGFQYRFSNQGGDRVKPTGSIVIRSIFGWVAKKVNANPYDGNVLPGTTRKFTPEWSRRDSVDTRDQELSRHESYSFKKSVKDEWHNFALGIFRAKVVATFGTTHQEAKSKAVYFVVFPWELLLVLFIIAIPVYVILRTLLRRYNRSIIRKAQARFGSGQ